MALQQRIQLDIYAAYRQFYLWDPASPFAAPVDYTEEDCNRRLKPGDHIVAVFPERYETVPVEIEIHDSEPGDDSREWDHIAECSLHVTGDRITVEECCGQPIADLAVEPGWYRLRSFHGGLSTVRNDWDGKDHYRVVLWRAPADAPRVIKQWTPGDAA